MRNKETTIDITDLLTVAYGLVMKEPDGGEDLTTFKQMQKWGKIRAKGKRRFLLVNGLLIPGLGFALLALLIVRLWPGNLFMPDPSRNETPKVIILLPALVACIAVSYYWALKLWDSNEKTYKDARESEKKLGENLSPPE